MVILHGPLHQHSHHVSSSPYSLPLALIYPVQVFKIETVLAELSIEEIWGISRGFSKRLRLLGIDTALKLRESRHEVIRQQLGVVGERIVWELRGWSCLLLELKPKPKKSTCVSRSFGQRMTELAQLKEAIACYTSKAAYKLRCQKQAATTIKVFIETSKHDEASCANSIKLQYAASGIERPWWMKSSQRSPRYTTRWKEIPTVKAEWIETLYQLM